MSALLYLAIGTIAVLTARAIAAAQADVEQPGEEPGRGIRVNPGRESW